MADIFPPSGSSRYSFGTKARIISGAVVLDPPAKTVVMTTAGNITIKTQDGTSIPFVGLAAGAVIPFVVAEVVSISGGGAAATVDG